MGWSYVIDPVKEAKSDALRAAGLDCRVHGGGRAPYAHRATRLVTYTNGSTMRTCSRGLAMADGPIHDYDGRTHSVLMPVSVARL